MEKDYNLLSTPSTDVSVKVSPKLAPPAWCKWFILAIAFIINVLISGVVFSFGILLIELLKEFDQGKGRTAAVGSVAIGLMFGVGPLAGGLCKRWSTRTVSLVGAVLSFVSLLASGYSNSLNALFGTYSILVGIGFGLLNLTSMLCVAEHFGEKMGLACALTSCGSGVGNLVFPIVMNKLIGSFGWRHMLIILAGIQTLAIVCSAAMFPQITDGHNICGCKKRSKPELEEQNKKMSIPSLYPNVYRAFKLLIGNTIDKSVVDPIEGTSPVEPEFMVSVDTMPNMSDLVTNFPSSSNSRSNVSNSSKENSEQMSTSKKTLSAQTLSTTTSESEHVSNIFTIDAPFTHQTTLPEQPLQDLNTSIVVDHPSERQSKSTLANILSCDLFVFRNIKYVIFLISCLLSSTGAGVPPIVVSDHARSFNVSPGRLAILVSVMGVTGTVGRLLAGLAACHSKVDITALYMIQMFIGGIMTLITPILLKYWFTMLFSALFGLFYGVTAGLDPAMLGKFVGNENMAMGYGFFSLALGIGSGISAPIAGSLRDLTGNYNCSFYVAGILMVLSSVCIFFLCMTSRTRSKDLEVKEHSKAITLIRFQVLH